MKTHTQKTNKKNFLPTLYFAYGANTNVEGMAYRCPNAEPIKTAKLKDWQLVFRGVADVIPCNGDVVTGVLWRITERCEKSLDRFEGFPTLYVKRYVKVSIDGQQYRVMFYVMRSRSYTSLPSACYLNTILEGYDHFQIDRACVHNALERVKADLRDDLNGIDWMDNEFEASCH